MFESKVTAARIEKFDLTEVVMLIYMYPMMSSCYRNIFNVKYLENGVEFNSGKTGNHPWASHCTMIFDLGRPHRAVLDPAADPCN